MFASGTCPGPNRRIAAVTKVRTDGPKRFRDRPGSQMYGLSGPREVAFSPDGKTLAAAQFDGFDPPLGSGRAVSPTSERSSRRTRGSVTGALAFSPDGKTLFSGGGDHLVRTWDLTAAEPRERLKPEGPIGGLGGIAFSPDGTKLAVSDAQFVRIWDLSDTRNLSRLPAPKTRIDVGPTGSLTFSPSGKTLICGGDLNTSPSMWDVSGLEPARLGDLHTPSFWGIRSMSFASDGETLAAGYNDHKVRVWDMRGAEPKERLCNSTGDERSVRRGGDFSQRCSPGLQRPGTLDPTLGPGRPRAPRASRSPGHRLAGFLGRLLARRQDPGRGDQRRDTVVGHLRREAQGLASNPERLRPLDGSPDQRLPGILDGIFLRWEAADRGRPDL